MTLLEQILALLEGKQYVVYDYPAGKIIYITENGYTTVVSINNPVKLFNFSKPTT